MEKSVRNPKRAVVAVLAMCICLAVFAAAYIAIKPQGIQGNKNITVEIIAAGDSVRTVEITTGAEFLRQALEEQNLISGDESEFGLFVKTVDGVIADESNQEWWCFTKNGESIMTGVDDTPIEDGGHYEITLTVGY